MRGVVVFIGTPLVTPLGSPLGRGDDDGRYPHRRLHNARQQLALQPQRVPLAHLVAAAHARGSGAASGLEPRRARSLCADAELRVRRARSVSGARQQLGARAPGSEVGSRLGAFVDAGDCGRRVRRVVRGSRPEYRRVPARGLRHVHVHPDARTKRTPRPRPVPRDRPADDGLLGAFGSKDGDARVLERPRPPRGDEPVYLVVHVQHERPAREDLGVRVSERQAFGTPPVGAQAFRSGAQRHHHRRSVRGEVVGEGEPGERGVLVRLWLAVLWQGRVLTQDGVGHGGGEGRRLPAARSPGHRREHETMKQQRGYFTLFFFVVYGYFTKKSEIPPN